MNTNLKILFIIIFFLSSSLLFSETTKQIDKKIAQNKKINNAKKKQQNKKNIQIKVLAKQISRESKELLKLEDNIEKLDNQIEEQKKSLLKANADLKNFQKNASDLLTDKNILENKLVQLTIEDFASSLALNFIEKESIIEIIDYETYLLFLQDTHDRILTLDADYLSLTQNKKEFSDKIVKIKIFITKAQNKKKKFEKLKMSQNRIILSLESKHKKYQRELKNIIKKQNAVAGLLSNLNILKKAELKKDKKLREQIRKELLKRKKKEELAKLKREKKNKQKKVKVAKKINYKKTDQKKRFAKNIDLDVKKIGSSTKGINIVRYRGKKTIAPLRSYKIVKKFGKYYDPVYKIELFSEAIVLKTKRRDAKVRSVLAGRIVYAKENAGILDNVVIIRHKDNIHTIYSHLDDIPKTLKVGQWVKKGYVIGRVKDKLTFQATKNSSYINPKELF